MRAYSLFDDRKMDFAPLPLNRSQGHVTQKRGDENVMVCDFGLLFRE
jgi:hypothetical protein